MPVTLTWSSDRSLRVGCDAPALVYRTLTRASVGHVIDIVPCLAGVQIEFVAHALDPREAERAVRRVLESETRDIALHQTRTIAIPVCYEPPYAPDLDALAERAGLSPEAVIELHSGASYRVEVIGFSPGFGYLSGLPEVLHTPRLDSPRTRIPAGSVGIAGEHTGVYPQATPGGWNLIGRTARVMFDPQRDPPALVGIGDLVRFEPVSGREFEDLLRERS